MLKPTTHVGPAGSGPIGHRGEAVCQAGTRCAAALFIVDSVDILDTVLGMPLRNH